MHLLILSEMSPSLAPRLKSTLLASKGLYCWLGVAASFFTKSLNRGVLMTHPSQYSCAWCVLGWRRDFAISPFVSIWLKLCYTVVATYSFYYQPFSLLKLQTLISLPHTAQALTLTPFQQHVKSLLMSFPLSISIRTIPLNNNIYKRLRRYPSSIWGMQIHLTPSPLVMPSWHLVIPYISPKRLQD